MSAFLERFGLALGRARRARASTPPAPAPVATDALPLRAELFSVSQLEQHARTLAGWHGRRARARGERPTARRGWPTTSVALAEAHALVTDAVERGTPHHAGGRVVRRQLLPRRGADPDRAPSPARAATAASCPKLANAPGDRARRASTTSRSSWSRTRTGGSTSRRCAHSSASYQAVQPAAAGRAVGDPDHAAAGADREPAPRGRRHHRGAARPRARDAAGSSGCSRWRRAIPRSVVLVLAEHGRREPAADRRVRGRARAAACRGRARALALPITWLEQRLAEQGRTVEHVLAAGRPEPGRRPGRRSATASAACGCCAPPTGATSSRRRARSSTRCAAIPRACTATMDFATRDRYRARGRGRSRRRSALVRGRGRARGGAARGARGAARRVPAGARATSATS